MAKEGRLGVIVVCYGFELHELTASDMNHKRLLTELKVPLGDSRRLNDFFITYDGELINFVELCIDLTQHPDIMCALVCPSNYEMCRKSQGIEVEHMHPDVKGGDLTKRFNTVELDSEPDMSRLVYFRDMLTVYDLC